MSSRVVRTVLSVVSLALAASLGAQEGNPDEDRVNTILGLIDDRAMVEMDASFNDTGDYPKSIQLLRIRSRVMPHDEEIITDLIWMLGNVDYMGEAVSEGIRYMNENPQSSDRAFPLAQLYFNMNLFAKVPAILEEDILRDPPPHPLTFRMIGHSYRKMGFHKDALRVWEEYLKHYPDDDIIRSHRDRAAALVLDR